MKNDYVRVEVFTAVRIMMTFFWVLALCRLVGRCQSFREIYCHPPSALKMETVCFSETLASTDKSTRRQNPEEHIIKNDDIL
jgi:hypothetical protein